MVPTIILVGLVGFIIYLLVAPFVLIVDSNKALIRIKLFGIASAEPLIVDCDIVLLIRVFGVGFRLNITEKIIKSGVRKKKQKIHADIQAHPKPRQNKSFSLRKLMNVLYSFRFRVFRLHIDTGDYPLNGLLFPLFFWLSKWSGKDFQVNFNNRNELVMHLENSLARVLWAYIKPIKT
jgi:hypothetical protein